jgi:murein DD-endopeptidase MepM/ murein hydrolase activator NlpD
MTNPYINPIGPGLSPGRVDMGVDYSGAGNLYALGTGQITNVSNSGWPGGIFIGLKLSAGPDSGDYVYYAEDISPAVTVGQQVKAGQLIGKATGGSSGIEIGWAAPPGVGQTMAAESGQNVAGLAVGDPGAYPTGYGVDFSNLIQSLGGQPGIVSGNVQGAVGSPSGVSPGSSSSSISTASVNLPFPGGSFNPLNWPAMAANKALGSVESEVTKVWKDVEVKARDWAIRLGLIILGLIILYAGLNAFTRPNDGTTGIITSGIKDVATRGVVE